MRKNIMFGKLVRDGFPASIREAGCEPVTYIAGEEEYGRRLLVTLAEEAEELTAAMLAADGMTTAEKLVDVLEVVHALAEQQGLGMQRLEELRRATTAQRGGFHGRVVWEGNR